MVIVLDRPAASAVVPMTRQDRQREWILKLAAQRAKREHLTIEQVWARYPRLASAVQDIIIGSHGEAGACLRDYRDGFDFSCEAVSHSGLTPHDRIVHAFRIRSVIRDARGGQLIRQ